MHDRKSGITKLYNDFFNEPTSRLYKLHLELDKLVCESIYGWKFDPLKNYNVDLFHLNQELHKKEADLTKLSTKGTTPTGKKRKGSRK
jgi:hypothetical protein